MSSSRMKKYLVVYSHDAKKEWTTVEAKNPKQAKQRFFDRNPSNYNVVVDIQEEYNEDWD